MAIISRGFIKLTHGKRFQKYPSQILDINEIGDLFHSGALKKNLFALNIANFMQKRWCL
jgi:hypothetical protein